MNHHDAAALLMGQNHILILTHRRPDGDTIGSGAALCLGLRQLGKTAYLHPNEDAGGIFLPYMEGLLPPDGFIPHYVVAVDTASVDLLPDSAGDYTEHVDFSIDHHGSNTGYAHTTWVDPSHAACGELVYLILKELAALTPRIAQLLYVAISTDTGCFAFSNTTPETHRIAAALMETGFDVHSVNKLHFRTKSTRRLRLESRMIQDMELLEEGRIAIATLPLSLLDELKATEEDLENITSFLEQLEGVICAITIRELTAGGCKLSVRSGPSINASQVCALLGGGGHPAAAGCSTKGSVPEARDAILTALRQVQGEAT